MIKENGVVCFCTLFHSLRDLNRQKRELQLFLSPHLDHKKYGICAIFSQIIKCSRTFITILAILVILENLGKL